MSREQRQQLSQKLSQQQRTEAIASLKQYFERNMPEPVGDLAAGLLLDFFLKEIGPVVYNGAIADAQAQIGQRIGELDGELYEEPFTYWSAQESKVRSGGAGGRSR